MSVSLAKSGKYLGRAVSRVLLALATFGGFCALLGAAGEMRVPAMRPVPLEFLAREPDLASPQGFEPPVRDGSRVRVEGFLRAEPSFLSFGHREVALQKLRVTHLQRRVAGTRFSSTRSTDVVGYKTPRLWLCADEQGLLPERVEVRLPRLWDGEQILLAPIEGEVGDAGTIPNNVFEHLSPHVKMVSPEAGQEWELWSIRQGERVTVVAPARHEAGRTVLQIEPGLGCVLSPEPWEEVTRGARRAALGQLVIGLALLSPVAWKLWRRVLAARSAKWAPGS